MTYLLPNDRLYALLERLQLGGPGSGRHPTGRAAPLRMVPHVFNPNPQPKVAKQKVQPKPMPKDQGHSYGEHASDHVAIEKNGQIKITTPKTPAEAIDLLDTLGKISDAAYADFAKVVNDPPNAESKVKPMLRLAHVQRQVARGIAMAKKVLSKATSELAFCPTGTGHGQDNSCSPTNKGAGDAKSSSDHNPQIDTPEFKSWFGDWTDPKAFTSNRKAPVSFAVNEDGTPKVFYHGTRSDFSSFEPGRPAVNSNVLASWETERHALFFSETPENAQPFTESGGESQGANVKPVYLDVKAPLDLTSRSSFKDQITDDELKSIDINPRWPALGNWEMFDGEDGKKLVEGLKSLGYDGVIFEDQNPDTRESARTWAVFSPTQIKSATGNSGKFDPNNHDIRAAFCPGAPGSGQRNDCSPGNKGTGSPDPVPTHQSGAPQTDSPQFKAWFGKSQVVDASGKPMVVYHGTTKDFNAFQTELPADKQWGMFDRQLGAHFAEDPAVTDTFTQGQYTWPSDFYVSDHPGETWYRDANGDLRFDGVTVVVKRDEQGSDSIVGTYDPKIHGDTWQLKDKVGPDAYLRVIPPGGHIIPAYLSIQHPLVVTPVGREMDQSAVSRTVGSIVFPESRALFVAAMGSTGRSAEEMGKAWDLLSQGKPYDGGAYEKYSSFEDVARNFAGILNDRAVAVAAKTILERKGYDGVLYANTSDNEVRNNKSMNPRTWIAFHPSQIKSATGNIGTFDPKSANIAAAFCPGAPGSGQRNDCSPPNKGEGGAVSEPKIPTTQDDDLPGFSSKESPAANPQTQTPQFKRWFGSSKVVDANGTPAVVYHGTTGVFDKFNPDLATMGGVFWFTSDAKEASEYATNKPDKTGGNVKSLYAKIENPAGWDEYNKFGIGELKSRGFDGTILRESDGSFSGFVFKGEQFKSATGNKGTFNPRSRDIRAAFCPTGKGQGQDNSCSPASKGEGDAQPSPASKASPAQPVAKTLDKGFGDPADHSAEIQKLNADRNNLQSQLKDATDKAVAAGDVYERSPRTDADREEFNAVWRDKSAIEDKISSIDNQLIAIGTEHIPQRPTYDLGGLSYEEAVKQKGDEWVSAQFDKYRKESREWESRIKYDLSVGRITEDQAKLKGFANTSGRPYKPLPETLYHVTTAADAVTKDGLKSRDELHQGYGKGLGGGESDTISFTSDPEIAKQIYASMLEAHDVASGAKSLDAMIEKARDGRLLDAIYKSYGGPTNPETGEPKELELIQQGMKRVNYDTFKPAEYAVMTPAENQNARFDFYKKFSFFRDSSGGPMDPLFFLTDVPGFAAIDRNQIGIVETKSKPKAQGFQVSALGEWRTNTGDAVQIKSLTRPKIDASAYLAFCPGGKGAGQDNSCPPPNKGAGDSATATAPSPAAAPAPAAKWTPADASDQGISEDLDYANTKEDVQAILEHYDASQPDTEWAPNVYTTPGGDIIEWDGKDQFTSFTPAEDAHQFVSEYDVSNIEAKIEDNLNKEFWAHGAGDVYHNTDGDNVESIMKDGIAARDDTRGMSNRNVGNRVYATTDPDEAAFGSYGDATITIHTDAMAKDGFKPYVELEPDVVEGQAREAFASAIGIDDFEYEYESAMSPNTIVFGKGIPAKYLSVN